IHLLAVEGDRRLGVGPLVRLVRAAVPDLHRPGAVVALRDLALPGQVLERMILGVDGPAVLAGHLRDAIGYRPRSGDAVVLQAQVPVQPGRAVLLNDEAAAGLAARVTGRLAGGGEVALCAVLAELVSRPFLRGRRHRIRRAPGSPLPPRGTRRAPRCARRSRPLRSAGPRTARSPLPRRRLPHRPPATRGRCCGPHESPCEDRTSASPKANAAFTRDRCVKACGKLPSMSPVSGSISSE